MFIILKNGHCFVPEDIGKKDILIVYDRIHKIENEISINCLDDVEVIDCSNKIICPGFIDQHVHITGGGGEEGPASKIPELLMGDIINAGVTTLVGVLGVDGITRNIAGLLAKARALEVEGITTYIYTGSYSIPTTTLTGNVTSDITLIDKIIGVGEIAIADHRSSHPSIETLQILASQTRTGGLLGGKPGIMHIHVGDGKEGLNPLFQLVEQSNFPIEMFVPTHLNRNKALFEKALEYAGIGGNIDFTAGETSEKGYSIPDALERAFKSSIDTEKITVSSDGNGSIPPSGGTQSQIGKVKQLFNDLRICILERNLDLTLTLKTVTSNVAKILKIYPKKGLLAAGSDADVLILNKDNFTIETMIIGGEFFIKEGKILKKGKYED